MNNIIRDAHAMKIEAAESLQAILQAITATEETIFRFAYYHSVTSAASTFSQFIAMSVLLEGQSGEKIIENKNFPYSNSKTLETWQRCV